MVAYYGFDEKKNSCFNIHKVTRIKFSFIPTSYSLTVNYVKCAISRASEEF